MSPGSQAERDLRVKPWSTGGMYRLHSKRWPWYLAACSLSLLWHVGESHLLRRNAPPVRAEAAPCESDVALSSVLELMSTPIPKTPSDNWRRPPCGEVEVEINGACWVLPAYPDGGVPAPPCPRNLWEHKGRCWKPVGRVERPGTTIRR